jgi:hypothetical protein
MVLARRITAGIACIGVVAIAAGVWLAPTSLVSAPVARQPPATVVIAVALPAGSDAWRGAQLGAHEAAHAARLFGAELDVRWIEPEQWHAESAAAAHVVISSASAITPAELVRLARERQLLVLNIEPRGHALRACDPLLFHVAPSEQMLQTARTQAQHALAESDSVAYWHATLDRYGAAQLNERYRRAHGRGMNEAAWAAWLAVKIAWEAAQRTGSSEPRTLGAFLSSERAIFDGHKGIPLSFRAGTGQLRQPVYIIRHGSLLEEVPSPRDAVESAAVEVLDRAAGSELPCAG